MRFIILSLVALTLAACASAPAAGPISCAAGPDCDAKWSRAMQWLQQNSSAKLTVTDMQLTAEESTEAAKPAFEVTKATEDDGRNFTITMRAWCAAGNCEDQIARLNTSFHRYVSGR